MTTVQHSATVTTELVLLRYSQCNYWDNITPWLTPHCVYFYAAPPHLRPNIPFTFAAAVTSDHRSSFVGTFLRGTLPLGLSGGLANE